MPIGISKLLLRKYKYRRINPEGKRRIKLSTSGGLKCPTKANAAEAINIRLQWQLYVCADGIQSKKNVKEWGALFI